MVLLKLETSIKSYRAIRTQLNSMKIQLNLIVLLKLVNSIKLIIQGSFKQPINSIEPNFLDL